MRTLTMAALITVVATSAASGTTVTLFQDDFNSFALGTTWQATTWDGGVSGENATGAPDASLVGGVNHGGPITLQMGSLGDANTTAEFKGVETIASFPITNPFPLTLDVRTTAANTHMPIEVGLLGSSGEWMKMFYTYSAWTNNFLDSAGDSDSYGLWPSGMTPGAYRRWVMTVDDSGVTALVYDASDTLRWSDTFSGLKLADLGSTATLVLRQQKGGSTASPGTTAPTAWVDSVTLTANVPEPSTIILAALGLLGLMFRPRKRE